MYYYFQVYGWAYDNDPEAASQGCGGSRYEGFNCEDVEHAKRLMLQKYPKFIGGRIVCKALDLDIRWDGSKYEIPHS